ncbi:hypothetical protein G7Y89_g4620 [Cudoniella acicularis]|uniref:GAR domain-containing protein n=1 Tax=Cudoniella acicularis TaxID=354080 RepID=A0A8H4RQJ1_9HELO|nr:hypothetical protein G7Y89_g4620 [Cudoniella acicularis]
MDLPQQLPKLFSPSAPRFYPVRTHTRNSSRSPTRERIVTDDILADLSPATTLEAFTNPSGKLKASVEAATPAERAFGIRATLASKKIQEWVDELSSWPWPEEGGSVGFEIPAAKRRKLSGEANNGRWTSNNLDRHGSRDLDEPEYIGSLFADDVDRYEVRVEEITEDMEDLKVEEIKRQVLDTHFSARSRPSSSASNAPMPSLFASYTKMDDFTAIVTATVLQALPNLSRLMRLMDVWSIRLLVLRKVPPLLSALDDMEFALQSGWKVIEESTNFNQGFSQEGTEFLLRESYEAMRNVLQEKVTKLGQDLDYMLDTLEGREDILPESWLDRMEALENDYGEWVVSGDRKVRQGEWERMARARREEEARRKEAEEAEIARQKALQEEEDARKLAAELAAGEARRKAEEEAETARLLAEERAAEIAEAQRLKAEKYAEDAKVLEEIRLAEIALRKAEQDAEDKRAEEAAAMAQILKRQEDQAADDAKKLEEVRAAESAAAELAKNEEQVAKRLEEDQAAEEARVAEFIAAELAMQEEQAAKRVAEMKAAEDAKRLEELRAAEAAATELIKREEQVAASAKRLEETQTAKDAMKLEELRASEAAAMELARQEKEVPESPKTFEELGISESVKPQFDEAPGEAQRQENELRKEITPQVAEQEVINAEEVLQPSIVPGTLEIVVASTELQPPALSPIRETKMEIEPRYDEKSGSPDIPMLVEDEETDLAPNSVVPALRETASVSFLHIPVGQAEDIHRPTSNSVDAEFFPNPGSNSFDVNRPTDGTKKASLELLTSQATSDNDETHPRLNLSITATPSISEVQSPPQLPPKTTLSSPQTPSNNDTVTPNILDVSPNVQVIPRDLVDVDQTPKVVPQLSDTFANGIRRASLPSSSGEGLPSIVPQLTRSFTVKDAKSQGRPSGVSENPNFWRQMQQVSSQDVSKDLTPNLQDTLFPGPHGEEWTFDKSRAENQPTHSRVSSRVSSSGDLSQRGLPAAGRTSKRHSRNISVVTGYPSMMTAYSSAEPTPDSQQAEPEEYFFPKLSPVKKSWLFPDVTEPSSPIIEPTTGTTDQGPQTSNASIAESNSGLRQILEVKRDESRNDNDLLLEISNALRDKTSESELKTTHIEVDDDQKNSANMSTPMPKRKSSTPPINTTITKAPLSPRQSVSSNTPTNVTGFVGDGSESPIDSPTPMRNQSHQLSQQDEPSPTLGRMRLRNQHVRNASLPGSTQSVFVHSKRQSMQSPISPTFSLSGSSDVSTSSFEAAILKKIVVSETPPPTSPKKNADEQLQEQISSLLESIPARIHLTSKPDTNSTNMLKPKKTRRSVTPSSRSHSSLSNSSQAQAPSFLLSPAYNKKASRPRPQSAHPEIKLYHLSRSTGEAPIKLFVRLVGVNGERVMVRVGGGWADLGEYLKEYASHHGRRSTAENDKIEIQDLPKRVVSTSSTTSSASIVRGGGRSTPMEHFRPQSAFARPMSSLNVRKTRKSMGETEAHVFRTPSTPIPALNRRSLGETPPSSNTSASRSSSRLSWTEDDISLGLAGPKSKKIAISEKDQEWVESMKEKVKQASAEKDKEKERERRLKERERGASFGEMDKIGATKRLFRKG